MSYISEHIVEGEGGTGYLSYISEYMVEGEGGTGYLSYISEHIVEREGKGALDTCHTSVSTLWKGRGRGHWILVIHQ